MSRRRKKRSTEEAPRSPNGRPIVAPQSRKTGFNKLRQMDCFPEAHDRICKGWPLSQVAVYIQDECHEYTDAAQSTLIKVLQNYRDSLPPAERAKYALPKSHQEAIQKVEKDLDELQEMKELYFRQKKRLDIDGKVEENIGKLLPTMTQDIRATLEILSKSANLKMDMGLHERHLGTVDIEAGLLASVDEKYEGTDVGTVLRDPKKRRRLLNIAEHMMSLSKRGVSNDDDDEGESGDPEGELVADDD